MGFAYCFNTFCKTCLSVPKLCTQADKTPQWETNTGIDFTLKLCWWQNHSHRHHINPHNFRSAATHSSIEYKTLQPFLLFCSTERKFLQLKRKHSIGNHYISVAYFMEQFEGKNKTIILQITHDCKHSCAQSAQGSCCLDLTTITNTHFLLLSIREDIRLRVESIPGLSPPQCLHRPVPGPSEEASGPVVGCPVRAVFSKRGEKKSSIGFRNGE